MISRFGSGIVDGYTDDIALLMQTCDDMEAALADWLARISPRFVRPATGGNRSSRLQAMLDPQLWRTLIIIWLSSPLAKRDFSDEVRGGMRSAIDTMNDRVLMSLIGRILDERMSALHSPAA